MLLRRLSLSILFCSACVGLSAQPLFEARAVWLTTTFGLDWPQTATDPAAQEEQLREIIAGARARGLNTVFFQSVARGDAFYRSDRLPWSRVLTGTVGVDPGFDPLGVAIEAAHEHGMELHAWINTYRIATTNTGSRTPDHVTETQPEWIEAGGDWLNPGYPGVNDWIVANVVELVTRYDVDAIHFDFARYDQGGYLRDDSLFLATNTGGIATKDDWRRENVNNLMRAVQQAVFAIKPWVKIGSTPIGNYDEACFQGALSGFEDVFQDSRLWLSEGLNDYLAPQLYWADSDAASPSFTCLVKDWVGANTSARHLYPGVGLYVPAVAAEVDQQIDVTRDEGAQGVSFFRETFTREEDFGGRFEALALQPPIALRFEAAAPETPPSVTATQDTAGRVHLEWSPSAGTDEDPVGWYAMFRREGEAPDPSNANDLIAVVYRDRISFDDPMPVAAGTPVFYSIVAVSRLGFVADPTEPIRPELLSTGLESEEIPGLSIEGIYPNPASNQVFIRYSSDISRSASVRIVDEMGRLVWEGAIRASNGSNVTSLRAAGLASGVYLLELTAGDRTVHGSFVIAR